MSGENPGQQPGIEAEIVSDPRDATVNPLGLSDDTISALDEAMAAFRTPEDGGDAAPPSAPPPAEEGGAQPDPNRGDEQPTQAPPSDAPPEAEAQPENPQFAEAWALLQQKTATVEERERALRELESQRTAIEDARTEYGSDRVAALRRLIAGFTGSSDDKAVDTELQSLYETLTGHVLGVDSGKPPSETTLLRRELEQLKRQSKERDAEAEKARLETERQQHVASVQAQCTQYVTDNSDQYPALAVGAEALGEDPGALLMGWADRAREQGQTDKTLADVASEANVWFQTLATKLASLSAPAVDRPPQQQRAPTQPSPGSRTLTTTRAIETPAKPKNGYIADPEQAMEQAWRTFQSGK